MIRILFICHGNICRSPMAEFVFRDMVQHAGLSAQIAVASAATSTEALGCDLYPPARRKLQSEGIPFSKRSARRVIAADYERFDELLCMDGRNLANLRRILGGDPNKKIRRLLECAGQSRDIADPWYTDDFDAAYRDIREGCAALLAQLQLQLASGR